MANKYTKVYLQLVFAVKNREALLNKSWRGDLFKYTSKVLSNRGHYALAVNGHKDHVHLFFDYSCDELISDLVREIKKAMTNYIADRKLCKYKFNWQTGYGLFSHGYREKSQIIEYIKNQEEHHKTRFFKGEYFSLLAKYEIDYKDEYVFNFL